VRIGQVSQPPPERPGRYQRTTGGLIGALVVTVLAIGAFVAFRAVNRTDLEVRPDPIDHLAAVAALQDQGMRPVYPSELPSGWVATSVDMPPADQPDWGLGILTDDDTFVGMQQSKDSVDDLLHEYVDENPREGEPVGLPGSLAPTWRSFSDEGGDRALATEVDGWNILVYGSATDADLRTLVATLTTEPLDAS
jgi:hypothetical protein